MKTIRALLLPLFAMLVMASGVRGENEKTPPPEFLELEKRWNEAHVAGDAKALAELWAEDLVVAVPKMPLFNKAQSMAIWNTGRMKFARYETSGLAFRQYGDTAVVSGTLLRERTVAGQQLREDWNFTKVYVKLAGRWQVVSWHASESAAGGR